MVTQQETNSKTVLKRTGIQKDDLVIMHIGHGNALLMSVTRPSLNRLYFENTGVQSEDKIEILNHLPDKAYAESFMRVICQITGLEAKIVHETENYISFKMQKGNNIFAKK
ncbi:MAG: hypothetical protein WC839_01110 [Candidatus Paceibacterota bacterium]